MIWSIMRVMAGATARRFCVASRMNTTFDGDEMNVNLILDHYMHTRMARLEPHLSVLDLGRPKAISRNIKLPAPVIVTISNWMYQDRQKPSQFQNSA